jgi:maleylacetoacetate isomerase
MKLYQGDVSSASWRLRWALAFKGVTNVDHVILDITKGEHHEALKEKNAMLQVPTLELDDGQTLTETVAIIEWLEETIPSPALLPKDPIDRAYVRSLVQLINAGIHPLQNTKVRNAVAPNNPEAQRAWCSNWILRGLTAYETQAQSRAQTHSLGTTFTMADLFLIPQIRNAHRYETNISHLPIINRIWTTCLEMPSAQSTRPETIMKGQS